MADETKPRAPAKKRTGRKTTPRKQAVDAQVVSIFGEDAPVIPTDPDGIRPVNDRSKRRARKTVRLGTRMTEVEERIKAGEITMQEFVEALTPEELVRGQLRDHNGSFAGRPPTWVPAEFHAACMRELLKRGEQIWKGAYLKAVQVFADIAADPGLEPKDRMKAAQYVVERLAGKTPERIEVAAADPWQTIISGIVAEAEDESIQRASRVLGGEQ